MEDYIMAKLSNILTDRTSPGLRLLTPTSVAVGSGSGSVGATGTVTLTGASSVSLNGCFSSTYKSYQIIFRGTQTIADTFGIRVRASGTDLSSSSYRWSYMFNISSNSAYNASASASATFVDIVGGNVDAGFYVIEVNNPFAAAKTSFHHRAHFLNAANSYNVSGHGLVDNTTSYDGVTFLSTSGNMTGTISVYGYKD